MTDEKRFQKDQSVLAFSRCPTRSLKTSWMTAWKDKDWTDGAATGGELAKEVVVNSSRQVSILSRFEYLEGQSCYYSVYLQAVGKMVLKAPSSSLWMTRNREER